MEARIKRLLKLILRSIIKSVSYREYKIIEIIEMHLIYQVQSDILHPLSLFDRKLL